MYSLGCGKSAINDRSEPQKALHASVTPAPTHRRLSGRPRGFFFSKVSFFRRLTPARSVVVCRCFLFSKVSFFSHYPLLHTDKKPPKTVRGTQHVRASRDQVWLCQIQVIWVSRFVPENRRERAQRPVAVTTLEGLWPGVVTRLGSVYKIFLSSTKTMSSPSRCRSTPKRRISGASHRPTHCGMLLPCLPGHKARGTLGTLHANSRYAPGAKLVRLNAPILPAPCCKRNAAAEGRSRRLSIHCHQCLLHAEHNCGRGPSELPLPH